MRRLKSGGGWRAIWYVLRQARRVGGFRAMYKALRSRNACKTCALGMGGQLGGMVNEAGRFPEVCKKSVQAMAADMAGAIHPHFFDDFSLEQLRGFSSRELEAAGRIVKPLYAGPLDSHYRAIDWPDAIERIAAKLRRTNSDETFFYSSGRSSNEAGFLLQLFARAYGTNNVNSCSYYCHQASGVALASVTGSGTATVALEDVAQTDLLFIIGANPASNHPRLLRTIVEMKRKGGKVIVINPLRETGLVRFNVPSDVRSLLFGSKIADLFIHPHIGGDIALLTGIARTLLERNAVDANFVSQCADDWNEFAASVRAVTWPEIIESSGVDRETIKQAAAMYAASKRTIFCWAMGLTHHEHGVKNVQAIANVAMMRGMLGKPGAGLLPLRGHSNVQGIGSMGAYPKLRQIVFDRLEKQFGINIPATPGLDTIGCMHRAAAGEIRFALCLGGNLFGSNPDSSLASRALGTIDMAVYLNTTMNTGHAHGRGRETIILPVRARDEESQPTTQESMFNYVRMSDGGPARHDGPRGEVDILANLGAAVIGPRVSIDWNAMRDHTHLRSAIAAIIPGYEPVRDIDATKQEFQIPGRTLHEPKFATETGRAKFHVVNLPAAAKRNGHLRLMTMRSEGQFNTVVYEEHDVYRGQERRDVILMNASDIRRLGLQVDQRVRVRSSAGALANVLVREFEIRAGNAAMYYPEANALVPMIADPQSGTPPFKSVMVTIEPDSNTASRFTEPLAASRHETSKAAAAPARNLKAC